MSPLVELFLVNLGIYLWKLFHMSLSFEHNFKEIVIVNI